MARPLRIEYEGAFYHVTARGNDKKKIFLSVKDYDKFLSYLSEACRKYGVVLHAYVLMGNHYHLIVETPQANLSVFMHSVNGPYTTYFNIKRKRSGHLFQGRYKAILVDKDSYLLELSRYIHLNPVKAHMVEKPEEYAFSSYAAYISSSEESMVSRDLIWGMISPKSRKKAPGLYAEFVTSALKGTQPDPFEHIYGGMILGTKPFIKETLKRLDTDTIHKNETSYKRALSSTHDIEEIIRMLSLHFKVSEDEIINASPYKTYAVYLSRNYTPASNTQIGKYFGNISSSAVTKIRSRIKEKMAKDKKIRQEMAKIEDDMSRVNG
jgi:REP element-mobilizing transposase RayT